MQTTAAHSAHCHCPHGPRAVAGAHLGLPHGLVAFLTDVVRLMVLIVNILTVLARFQVLVAAFPMHSLRLQLAPGVGRNLRLGPCTALDAHCDRPHGPHAAASARRDLPHGPHAAHGAHCHCPHGPRAVAGAPTCCSCTPSSLQRAATPGCRRVACEPPVGHPGPPAGGRLRGVQSPGGTRMHCDASVAPVCVH